VNKPFLVVKGSLRQLDPVMNLLRIISSKPTPMKYYIMNIFASSLSEVVLKVFPEKI
jgi:hypothetical protein